MVEKTQTYMKQLDGLRAVAILAVIVTHYWPVLQRGINWSHWGVELFFVLSGFLITGILLRCRRLVQDGKASTWTVLRQFFIRRGLRIFPIFYGTLAVGVLLKISPVRESLPWHLFYLSNFYVAGQGRWIDRVCHFWSLAVEEQFYLFWAGLILLVPRKWLFGAIVVCIAAGPLSRGIGMLVGLSDVALWVLTPGAFATLGLGALLAYLDEQGGPNRDRFVRGCLWSGLPLVIGIVLFHLLYDVPLLDYVLLDLGLGLVFTWIVARAARGFKGPLGQGLELAPVVYLGKISYCMYVIHLFMPEVFRKIFDRLAIPAVENGSWILCLSVVATFLVAAFSWHFFEKPINDLKRFFPYNPGPVPQTRSIL